MFFSVLNERNGSVEECLTKSEELWVPALPKPLHCVLEQDTLSSA